MLIKPLFLIYIYSLKNSSQSNNFRKKFEPHPRSVHKQVVWNVLVEKYAKDVVLLFGFLYLLWHFPSERRKEKTRFFSHENAEDLWGITDAKRQAILSLFPSELSEIKLKPRVKWAGKVWLRIWQLTTLDVPDKRLLWEEEFHSSVSNFSHSICLLKIRRLHSTFATSTVYTAGKI